jgi:hypothetical protein
MKLTSLVNAKTGTIAAAAAVAVVCGAGASVAAGQITSAQIKDGTIQTGDLTKNNFARFTATENVKTADTAPNTTDPNLAGQKLVRVDAGQTPALTTIVLNRGTWKISGTAQFFHPNQAGVPGANATDIGVVTVPGLTSGIATNYTGDIPDGGVNGAQTSFEGTIKITADNTPVVISGALTSGGAGTATATVTATQYEYVKLFKGGKPS